MNNKRLQEAFKWLYQNCSHVWFNPLVLSRKANPAGNPPELSETEIYSIFQELLSLEYIIPIVNQHGQSCFILNETKQQEWKEKMGDLGKRKPLPIMEVFEKKNDTIGTAIAVGIAVAFAGSIPNIIIALVSYCDK